MVEMTNIRGEGLEPLKGWECGDRTQSFSILVHLSGLAGLKK